METSLSVENNPLQAKVSTTSPSTQDAQQFGHHMTSGQSSGEQSVSDKTTAERMQDGKGESSGMDDTTVAEIEAVNRSSETDMATNST